ncbi:hypothetical protein [Salinicola acroporae]|uniref:Pentapeptide MXKDX repeat protein n=1 Tax=Salinicola acroporae TaxID=1541440 RepID=A0ABT6I7I6_9GAMM|nr:hypothetical protein [Salinicola acroporae]MDH4573664.1 hypothetical protein [Salinicola acroporae]
MNLSTRRRFGIATGLILAVLSGAAMAQTAMDDSAPNSSSDQMGMASKDSANRDAMVNGMPSSSQKSAHGSSMDDSAPNSSSDQMGMASKDSANRDGMVKGMPRQGDAAPTPPTMDNSAPLSGSDQDGAAGKDSVNREPLNTGPAQ